MTRRRSGFSKLDDWTGVVVASDEVGYGAYAGPLVVCAATAPVGWDDPRIRDSKLFEKERGSRDRSRLYEEFYPDARFQKVFVVVSSEDIDRRGVYTVLLEAHARALKEVAAKLPERPFGVVDGKLPVHKFGLDFELVSLPAADKLVPECSLASVLAKVTRDRMMIALETKFPGYGFAAHKGYGTPAHEGALQKLGPCPQHRASYAPIAKLLAERKMP